jgi:hypothetical protein
MQKCSLNYNNCHIQPVLLITSRLTNNDFKVITICKKNLAKTPNPKRSYLSFRGHTVLARLRQNVPRPVPKVPSRIQERWEGGKPAGTSTSLHRYIGSTQTASGPALSLYENVNGAAASLRLLPNESGAATLLRNGT